MAYVIYTTHLQGNDVIHMISKLDRCVYSQIYKNDTIQSESGQEIRNGMTHML